MATTRPNGKGDRPRKVDGPKYRDNFDSIKWGPKDWDYPEGSKTKEQRISAMIYGGEIMGRKPYPDWICNDCGRAHGKRPEGNPYGATYHMGKCGICGEDREVTEPRDWGHLREGWGSLKIPK